MERPQSKEVASPSHKISSLYNWSRLSTSIQWLVNNINFQVRSTHLPLYYEIVIKTFAIPRVTLLFSHCFTIYFLGSICTNQRFCKFVQSTEDYFVSPNVVTRKRFMNEPHAKFQIGLYSNNSFLLFLTVTLKYKKAQCWQRFTCKNWKPVINPRGSMFL